ncbi:MAG: leucine-rich repeat domain-containing protein [Bacteroides sp.]|nr:leucine-rich repeat domain-containing protein [Bacteroides sp.]
MNLKKVLLIAAGLGIMLNVSAQKSKRYTVARPGALVEMLTEEEANEITHLILQGKLNAVDFRHLRDEFKNLQILDISTTSISMYTGKNGTHPDNFYIYPANCIPAYAFCKKMDDGTFVGKTSLTQVILSDKTKNIEDAAFKGCTNLKVCQIRKKTPPNLMPEALADSVTGIFVPLGSSDSYRRGERWENFAFIEGEPVGATVQIATMGSLASELVRMGIQPNDVNFLAVEGKMDEADFTLIRNYMPNLVSIDLSKSNATVIPDYTFTQKKYLLKVSLPHALKSIGQRAFSGCTRLAGTLELPPTVTAIEYGAFMGCDNLRHVLATGNKITTLGDSLFGNDEDKLIYK